MGEDVSARRRKFRLAAIAAPVLLLLAAEVVLRATGFVAPLHPEPYAFVNPNRQRTGPEDLFAEDADLFWRLRPGAVAYGGTVEISEAGFRAPWTPDDDGQARRVLCLGDSSTFGLHVRAREAWPAALEQCFRRSKVADVRVLNLGVPGYTTHQGRVLLESVCAELRPDVVVVAFGAFNDWVPALGRIDREQRAAPAWHDVRVIQLGAWLAGASVESPGGGSEKAGGHADSEVDLRVLDTRDHDGPRRVPIEQFAEDLRAMSSLARAHDAQFVVVSEPLPATTRERNPAARAYRDAARDVAQELGVRYVDGWAVFERATLADHPLFVDFCHPAPRGHQLLARAVHDALVVGVLASNE